MRWIKLKDLAPSVEIDGEKVLLYRVLNDTQERQSYSIHNTIMVKYCNPDETWWMRLPEKPIHIL